MPTATEILRHEHEAVLKMLAATQTVAQRLEQGEKVPPQRLDDLLEFFRVFTDQCHHGKEEDLLFPLLESKGLPRQGGPVGVMLGEHEQGRALIRAMAESAQAYAAGTDGSAALWAQAARGYVRLLEAHIDKENNVLFRIAEQMLSAQEQQQLAERFEKLEVEKMGAGTHQRLHAKMEKLLAEVAAH